MLDGLGEELEGVLGAGDVFLADVAAEARVFDGFANGGVVEFLGGVKFMPAGDSSGVIVGDVLVVGLDGANDITFHDLHVVNIVE